MNSKLFNAHIPTWIKASLVDAAMRDRTYSNVGHSLAGAIEGFDGDAEKILKEDTPESLEQPSAALRLNDTDMGLALLYAKQHGTESLSKPVKVCRHPGTGVYVSVPFYALGHFHFRDESGGVQRRSGRPFLYARMSCRWIPEDAYFFGHSCTHGPPPHDILVCITQVANSKALYRKLRAFAGGREQLKAETNRLSDWREQAENRPSR
jgi:hypothetical protein